MSDALANAVCERCQTRFDPAERIVNSNGELYHENCFVCAQCFRQFPDGLFYEVRSHTVCKRKEIALLKCKELGENSSRNGDCHLSYIFNFLALNLCCYFFEALLTLFPFFDSSILLPIHQSQQNLRVCSLGKRHFKKQKMFLKISLDISEFLSLFLDILCQAFPLGQLDLVSPFKNEVEIFLQNICKHIF